MGAPRDTRDPQFRPPWPNEISQSTHTHKKISHHQLFFKTISFGGASQRKIELFWLVAGSPSSSSLFVIHEVYSSISILICAKFSFGLQSSQLAGAPTFYMLISDDTTLENKKADYNKRLNPSQTEVENHNIAQCHENEGKIVQ